jgi:hypothetical protein
MLKSRNIQKGQTCPNNSAVKELIIRFDFRKRTQRDSLQRCYAHTLRDRDLPYRLLDLSDFDVDGYYSFGVSVFDLQESHVAFRFIESLQEGEELDFKHSCITHSE